MLGALRNQYPVASFLLLVCGTYLPRSRSRSRSRSQSRISHQISVSTRGYPLNVCSILCTIGVACPFVGRCRMIGSESHEKRMRAPSSKNECPKRKEREASDMRDRIIHPRIFQNSRSRAGFWYSTAGKQDRYSHWPSE